MKNFLFCFILISFIVLISGCAKKEVSDEIKTEQTPEKTTENLESCANGGQCEEGYTCYDSRYGGMGPNGLVSGPQEGDLLCHENCEDDSDCANGKCQEIDLKGGDIITTVKLCIRE